MLLPLTMLTITYTHLHFDRQHISLPMFVRSIDVIFHVCDDFIPNMYGILFFIKYGINTNFFVTAFIRNNLQCVIYFFPLDKFFLSLCVNPENNFNNYTVRQYGGAMLYIYDMSYIYI